MVDRAPVLDLVEDQLVLLVEIEHAELFARFVLKGDPDIGQKRAPGRDHRAFDRRLARHSLGHLVQGGEVEGRLHAHALGLAPRILGADGHQVFDAGGEHGGQRAEPGQQGLGDRFDVALRLAAEQEKLQQFVVRKMVQAGGPGAGAQPLSVT